MPRRTENIEIMGTKISEAQLCIEKIKYFHENAGIYGYDQAKIYYDKLSTLATSASKSKNYKSDAGIIIDLKKSVDCLMQEMERRT